MTEGRRVLDQLRDAILGGIYEPGQALRQEEIADRFRATRMPIREALRALHREGLVHSENRRARVAAFSVEDLNALYKMRERLEPLALAESMPNLTEDDIDTLNGIQVQIEAGVDVDEFLRLDQELHLRSYAGCDVPILLASVTDLWNATHIYRRRYVGTDAGHRLDIVNTEHRLLVDAIRRRDQVDAERLVAGHIRRTRVQLERESAGLRA